MHRSRWLQGRWQSTAWVSQSTSNATSMGSVSVGIRSRWWLGSRHRDTLSRAQQQRPELRPQQLRAFSQSRHPVACCHVVRHAASHLCSTEQRLTCPAVTLLLWQLVLSLAHVTRSSTMASSTRALRGAALSFAHPQRRSAHRAASLTHPTLLSLTHPLQHRLSPAITPTSPSPSPHSHPCVRSFSRLVRASASSASPSSSTSGSVLPSVFSADLALRLLRACWTSPRIPSVELIINLNLDPRKQNQTVRGTCSLPHGTGQRVRIAVFARGDKAKEALDAGADIVGAEDLVQRIVGGDVAFDRAIATPDCMALVGRVARILGPRGLMPNPKMGTVTAQVAQAVAAARQGQVTFKTDKGGVVHVQCGKMSFTHQQLVENLTALTRTIMQSRPAGAKGNFIRDAYLHATHSPAVPLDMRQEPFKAQIAAPNTAARGTPTDAQTAAPMQQAAGA